MFKRIAHSFRCCIGLDTDAVEEDGPLERKVDVSLCVEKAMGEAHDMPEEHIQAKVSLQKVELIEIDTAEQKILQQPNDDTNAAKIDLSSDYTEFFNPSLFKRSLPFWPPNPPGHRRPAKSPQNIPLAGLFMEYDQIADHLINRWTLVAQERLRRGINVLHLVDFFEDAIIQQW